MGWNLANAFEKPVHAKRDSSLVEESIALWITYWGKLESVYGGDTLTAVSSLNLDGRRLDPPERRRAAANMNEWIDSVMNALPVSTNDNGSPS